MDFEVTNSKINALSQILIYDVEECLNDKSLDIMNASFIVSESIADIVGWYSSALNHISPDLKEVFLAMIKRSVEVYEKRDLK